MAELWHRKMHGHSYDNNNNNNNNTGHLSLLL